MEPHEAIHEYLVAELATDRESFALDDNLLAQGIIDSIAIVHLVEFLEQRFDIEIAEKEMVPENFQSLAALSAFVRKKQAA